MPAVPIDQDECQGLAFQSSQVDGYARPISIHHDGRPRLDAEEGIGLIRHDEVLVPRSRRVDIDSVGHRG
jgi:hypothetical protein